MRSQRLLVLVLVTAVIVATVALLPYSSLFGKPSELRHVRFVLNFGALDGHHVPYFAALSKGFFRDEGISLEVIPGKNSPYAVELVTTGKADLGLATLDVVLSAVSRGAKLSVVFQVFRENPAGLFVIKGSGVRSLADLQGKTVGALIGSTQDLQFDVLFKRQGLKSESVNKVNIGSDVVTPLASRRVDAVVGWVTDLATFKREGIDVEFIRFSDLGLNYPSLVIFGNEEYVKANADVVKRFLEAVRRGIVWAYSNKEQAVDTAMSYRDYNPPAHREVLLERFLIGLELMGAKDPTKLGVIEREALIGLSRLLVEAGKLSREVRPEEVINDVVAGSR
ncbi:MAG: ABC transporter substrate-binding protein [Thaumarchaeota archaeon]|nr:ABC transporter substrate-binding protein [Candidatus Calditenuaceae archaeon]MDW8041535.1 ABC transporter substrate-binding protein [Nitrososphaerota archaeon]